MGATTMSTQSWSIADNMLPITNKFMTKVGEVWNQADRKEVLKVVLNYLRELGYYPASVGAHNGVCGQEFAVAAVAGMIVGQAASPKYLRDMLVGFPAALEQFKSMYFEHK